MRRPRPVRNSNPKPDWAFSVCRPNGAGNGYGTTVMNLKNLDKRMRLAISIIQRCVAGEGIELEQKTLLN